jgi:Family of unknown function (DUF6893)
MNDVGYVFLGLLAVVALFALVFVAVAVPDIARYLRMRRM